MKISVSTSVGVISLTDERMEENVRAAVAPREGRDIEVRTLMSPQVKSMYETNTPFGKAYIKHYKHVCGQKATLSHLFREHAEMEIEFLTVE